VTRKRSASASRVQTGVEFSSPVLVCFFVFLFLVSCSVFTISDWRWIPLLRLLVRFFVFLLVSCSVSKRVVTVFCFLEIGGGCSSVWPRRLRWWWFSFVPACPYAACWCVGVPVLPEVVWW
jgi:hypothetical protein